MEAAVLGGRVYGCHLLALKQASYEPKTFVLIATLPPWHLRVPRKCRKVLPM